jgi:hypothetical protein
MEACTDWDWKDLKLGRMLFCSKKRSQTSLKLEDKTDKSDKTSISSAIDLASFGLCPKLCNLSRLESVAKFPVRERPIFSSVKNQSCGTADLVNSITVTFRPYGPYAYESYES